MEEKIGIFLDFPGGSVGPENGLRADGSANLLITVEDGVEGISVDVDDSSDELEDPARPMEAKMASAWDEKNVSKRKSTIATAINSPCQFPELETICMPKCDGRGT